MNNNELDSLSSLPFVSIRVYIERRWKMKKILFKKIVVLSLAILIITSALTLALTASTPVLAEIDVWGTETGNTAGADVMNTTGLGDKDPREIAANVINIILGFLGIVAVIIILLGGFKWMTAGGNEDKVGEAKKLITAGIIGLVIIIASFAIATFVLTQLISATTTV